MNEKNKQSIPIPFNLDDFFTNQEQRDNSIKETIEELEISLIDNFKDHPFKVVENGELNSLQESIKEKGILTPIIVRKKDDDRYEMISGHRRKYACQLLGIEKIPCIVKQLSDDEATIIMVDSNLYREKILPSEKAFAYKMKYEAIKHQGQRNDLTSGQVVQKLSTQEIGEKAKESEKTVMRYIRLTYLIPELLNMVDNDTLGLKPSIARSPAVEISYLKADEQKLLLKCMEYNIATPSHAQAIQLKELSRKSNLTEDTIDDILSQEKPNQITKFKIQEDKLFKVLPKNIQREKIEDFVLRSCEYYTNFLKRKNLER